MYTLHGHTGGVNSVAWSPDGKRIVSGSADATVKIWDPTTRAEVSYFVGVRLRVVGLFCVGWMRLPSGCGKVRGLGCRFGV